MPSTSSTNVMTSEGLKKEERNREIEVDEKILATFLECSSHSHEAIQLTYGLTYIYICLTLINPILIKVQR